jgi:hypothetical protein
MKFEVGGIYDKDDNDEIPINAQVDSFIEQITGKDGHFNISSSLEGIENQKVEKGRDGFQIDSDISDGRGFNEESISSEAGCDDSGIGLDLEKPTTSSRGISNDADSQEFSRSLEMDLPDADFVDKAQIYGEKEPEMTVQPKRRLSDLDVHLKMMNDKFSPFFQPNPEEYPEIDGPPKAKGVTDRPGEKNVKGAKQQTEDDEPSLKYNSEVDCKDNNNTSNKLIADVGIDNGRTALTPAIELVNETSSENRGNGNELKERASRKDDNATESEPKKTEDEVKERNTEDVDLLDDMLEFMKNNRKGSRRSMTTDSGLGDDDYRFVSYLFALYIKENFSFILQCS